MPARMITNTESTVGYNKKLKQAAPGIKLGVNNDVNPGTKKLALKLMEGGPSKINLLNSHPLKSDPQSSHSCSRSEATRKNNKECKF